MGSLRRSVSRDSLTDVPTVRVGHAEDSRRVTGVTVVRFSRPAPVVLLVLGGASATYDTASLDLDATFGRRWAVFFAGGSVFGLDAARGVRTAILAAGGGHRVFGHPRRVAPVTGATLFDLEPNGASPLPDYTQLGRRATMAASDAPVLHGRRGAGRGALVGKYLGRGRASPGGVGSAARRVEGLGIVGALAVVNAVGAVRDPATDRWVAGAREDDGTIVPPGPGPRRRPARTRVPAGTTLAVLVTDVGLSRPQLHRAATVAAGGLARSVVPLATATDGDVLFMATIREGRRLPPEPYPGAWADRVGWSGAEVLARAVVRAVSTPDIV